MEWIGVAILAALVFGICFLVDKGFTRVFRSRKQHASGLAVRLNKRYGSFGIVIGVIGIAAIITGLSGGWLLAAGGVVLVLVGAGLVIYYASYGIFYDADTFLFMTVGKRSTTYSYKDITAQRLYNNQGHLLIELYMGDGNTVQLQSTMQGCFEFMDHAYAAWLRQTGRTEADCPFHDPEKSCWFPPVDGEE